MSDDQFPAPLITSDDRVAEVVRTLEDGKNVATRPQGLARDLPGDRVCARVLYRARAHAVWFVDPGVRPPAPGGVWRDDLITAACRFRFGVSRGTCRALPAPVLGTQLEFREWWPDAVREQVAADVRVACPDRDFDQTLHVRTAVFPGADQESVVFAAAYQACAAQFGPGQLIWKGASALHFTPTPDNPADPRLHCRYTVHRRGGRPVDLVVRPPLATGKDWGALVAFVRAECAAKFGPGAVTYSPELGETHFRYG
jgi:hypothetical protein